MWIVIAIAVIIVFAFVSGQKIKVIFIMIGFILLEGCNTTWKNMDIANPGWSYDDNLFFKNPIWGAIANNTIANNKSTPIPNPLDFCPGASHDPNQWTSSPTCTSQKVYYAGPTGGCSGGHMNYFPITYEGSLYWQDFSGPWYKRGDGDYNFYLRRNDKALYSKGWKNKAGVPIDAIGPEFDSDETVDNWDNTNTWWDHFHHDGVDKDNATNYLAPHHAPFAIVIGLAALDCEHDCHTELHPVYAMFIHVKDDPNDDQWAFFVRNWGNEGWCSNNQEYLNDNSFLGSKTIKVRIPHPKFTDVNISNWNVWVPENSRANMSMDPYQIASDGIVLTFNLDNPDTHSWFMGDISFKWKDGNQPAQPRNDFNLNPPSDMSKSFSLSQSADKERDEPLSDKIKQLDIASQKDLFDKLYQMKPVMNKSKVPPPSINRTPLTARSNKPQKKDYSNVVTQVPNAVAIIQKNKEREFILNYLRSKGIH